jgi:hypothetical protein
MSPLVMGVSCLARPYDLLALCTILVALQTIRLGDNSTIHRSKEFIYIAISSAAGLLTHYYFIFILLGCAVFLVFKLIKSNRRDLGKALISMIAGLVIFIIMHPYFLLPFKNQLADSKTFNFSEILPRLKITLAAFGTFFWQGMPVIFKVAPSILFGLIYPAMFISIIIFLTILYIKSRPGNRVWPCLINKTDYYIIFFFLWTAGIIILIYIFDFGPAHAMGPKYLSIVWPFFAFIPVLIIRIFGRFRTGLMTALILLQIFFGSLDMLYMNYPDNKRPEPISWLRNADNIMIDNVARGVLPGIIWHIPDTTLVFAADQEYLLNNIHKWKPMLKENSLYLSVLRYDSSLERQSEILQIIERNYEVVAGSGGYWGYGGMYKLRKKIEDDD